MKVCSFCTLLQPNLAGAWMVIAKLLTQINFPSFILKNAAKLHGHRF